MPSRQEALMATKADVQTHGIITIKYYEDANKCCAVGFLLKNLGMDDHDLSKLGGCSVDEIMNEKPHLHDFNTALKAKALFVDAGISLDELEHLQGSNDDHSVPAVLNQLDNMIVTEVTK